jgi:hypothetical protein
MFDLETLGSEPSKRIAVNFDFPHGIPEYCGEKLVILLGIHDQNLTRTVFTEEVAVVETFNSSIGNLGGCDVIEISRRCKFSCEELAQDGTEGVV